MLGNNELHVVVLAAGQGKRMQTSLPKVLHSLASKPLLAHVLEAAMSLNVDKIHVVIGHEAEKIQAAMPFANVHWVMQAEQKGTGHALLQALPFIPEHAKVLILSGDVPLIQTKTLENLISLVNKDTKNLALLVASPPNPYGFGRIIRNSHQEILSIVEEKDASAEQKKIHEIYTGICCANASDLKRWLPQLSSHNAQGEYYLTDIISLAVLEQLTIPSIAPTYLFEIQGVNTLKQLHDLERSWQLHLTEKLLSSGVQIADGNRLDIRGKLECKKDVFLDINVILEGDVFIGQNSHIGANSIIINSKIGENCHIHPHSIIQDAVIDDDCEIGPFARIRPGTHLSKHCKIGNFVEIKKSRFDEYSKANHLTYIGDSIVGKHVNIGAGTITCNYDGANKHQTIIKDHAFIGSDTQLIAPVTVGEYATIGAGSSIREDAPAHALTLNPNRQKSILTWKRPEKIKS